MKNILVLVLCLFASVASSFAQGKYQFSFIASPQFSWMNSDNDLIDSKGSRVGYSFGILSDRFIDSDRRYSFHSGFLISTLGGKVAKSSLFLNTIEKQEVKYKTTNIEVPLSMKLRTAQFHRNTYFVQLGLTNWFRISDEIDGASDDIENQYDDINFYNIGYNVGAGMEFDIGGNNAITMGVIYQNGFLDATENEKIDDTMRMNNIRVQLGVIF